MSIPVKVVRDGQSLQAAETITVEAGASLALQAGDSVALNLTRAQVHAYQEQGDDLVLQLTDGTTLTLVDFFVSKDKPSHLFLVEDDQLVAVEFPAGHDDGALLASYAVADGATAAGFESLTAAVAGAGAGGALGWVLGGLAVVGGGLAASGGGGSSSSGPVSPPPAGNPDTQPPSPASELAVSADGTRLTGRAEAGATVGVDVNGDGTADVTAVVAADGTFEVALDPPLTNGETLSVVVTDAAGNRSEAVQVVAGDTTAPAPVTDLLMADDGSGISGSGEPGATVEVDVDGDGQPDLTAVIGEDGRFDIALEPPLTNGETVSVVLRDPAGNSSDPVTVSGPDFPDPAQVDASNGSEIEGTAAPGSLIVITDDEGTPIGQTTVGPDGQWSYTPDVPLPHGTVVQVVVQDELDNQSPPTSVVVDGVAPAAPTLNPSNGDAFAGTAEPGAVITLRDSDGAPVGEVVAGDDGSWSITPTTEVPDGAQIIATATDEAGNTSDEASITVDATAPPPPILDASNGSSLSGTAEPGSTVKLSDDAGVPIGNAVADANGHWSFTPEVPLADGTVVVATAADAAGNVSDDASVTVDGVAPEPPVINSTNGAVISGTAEAGSLVVLADDAGNPLAQIVVDANGVWSHTFDPPLEDGMVVNATATDAAGNVSGSASETVDAIAPDVPVVDASNGTELSGVAEPGTRIIVADGDGALIGQTTVAGDGTWSIIPETALAHGTVVNVVSVDDAGNTSGQASIAIDAVAPEAPVIDASNGVVFSGTGEVGATITLFDASGAPIGQAVVEEGGTWTLVPEVSLADGAVVTAVATDAAGNSSSAATTTVDAVPPAAPTMEPSNGTVINGVAEAGAVIVLVDGSGVPIGTSQADGSGNWSFTPDTTLPHGTVINAAAIDAAGNSSALGSMTIDSVAPADPLVTPSNGSVISGTAEAGATIRLSGDAGNPLGEVVADAAGNWSFTPATALAHGNTVEVTATDAAGNISGATSVTIDALAPATPTIDPTNGDEITGTAEAGATITLTDGTGGTLGQTIADGSGNWSFTPDSPLADGASVTATASDASGNISGAITVTVDAVAPDAPVINPSNGSSISGTAEADATILLTDGNGNPIGEVTADGNGDWSFTPDTAWPHGAVITAAAVDAAGNASDGSSITVDAVAPADPVVTPSNGSVISGTAESGAIIRLTDDAGNPLGEVVADAAGNWSFTPATALAHGDIVEVTATDAAGNTSGAASVTIDALAPAMPTINPTNGDAITGTAEAGATITLTDGNGDPLGQAVADGSGNWSFTPSTPLPDGAVVNVTASDTSGNTSLAATVTVDAVAPDAPAINPSNGSSISGTAEADATILLTDGSGNPIGEVTADGNGDWSFTPGTALANGAVITAVAVDAAGNASDGSSITVDAVAPADPIVSPSNGSVISGTAEAGATIRLNDDAGNPLGEVVADAAGNWSFTPATALAHGDIVEVTATDAAGNTSGAASVTIDALEPATPTINPTNGDEITGTAEAGATITLTDGNGDPLGQAVADGSGNWSFTPSTPLPDGAVVNVTASDTSGNTSLAAIVTVDAVAPDAPVINPSNGSSISGTAEADATILLTDGSGNPIGEVTADGNGDWSFTPGAAWPHGAVITAVAVDAAGNASDGSSITVDAVAPADPLIDPSNGSVISGTAEAGATITLTDGSGAPIGQAIADGNGDWSFTPVTALTHGTVVNAVASDAAGNTSSAASLTIDAVPPAAPDIDASNGSVISGTAEAGATVSLVDGGGIPIGEVIADGSGNWSFTPGAALAHGTTIIATATDAAGNASGAATVTVDAVAPEAPVISPSDGSSITGTAEADATILLTDSSGNPLGQTTADGSGNWSFTPVTALAHGTTVNVTATDAAGNTSSIAGMTVDAVAPASPVIDPSNGSTISGSAEAGSTVSLTDGSGNPLAEVTADGSGNWSYSPATGLLHGTVVNATATDAAGNVSGSSSVTIDAVAPAVPDVAPSNGSMFSGTAEADATITLTDAGGNPIGEVTADSSGAWSFTPATPLPHGTVVEVTATDAAGNTSAASSVVTDAVPPTAPNIDPSNGSVVVGSAEAGATIRLFDGEGNLLGEVTADGNGDWTYTPGTPFIDGATVSATATDAAGNTSAATLLTVDAVAPSVPVIAPSNGSLLTGTAEAGATVTLVDGDGIPIGEVVADGTGSWSFTPGVALAHGTVVTATATDAAGNTSGAQTVTVDAMAPDVPLLDISNGSTIAGTAEAGATITLTDAGGAQIGEVVADGSGDWSFTPPSALAHGTVVNATATDAAGNTSGTASTTVDALPPPPPLINASNGEQLSGTAEAGATVMLIDGSGNTLGQVPVDGNGDWSFVPGTPLANGALVRAIATDAAGNASTDATIIIDAVAPAQPTLSISADGTTVTGTAEAGSEVQLVIDGDTANPITVSVGGSGNFTHTLVPPLIASEVITAVSVDAAGNTSAPAQVSAPDLQPPAFTLPEAADTWINVVEASDGIQVNVALRPTMNEGQVVTVQFTGQGGYEIETSHVLTAADILAGTATVTVAPSGAQGPFPQGAASITAALQGGPDATPQAFTVDTIAPATPVLSLLASVLGISAEPGTELMVAVTVGGVTANTTVLADNSGLASVNLLTGLSIGFTWDQLLNAQVDVTGYDPAGNASSVASLGIGLGLLAPVTVQNLMAASGLGANGLEFALTGVTQADSAVTVRAMGPELDVTLDPVLANGTGNFALDLFSTESLAQLGVTDDHLITLGDQISLDVRAVNPEGVASADYHLTLGQSGLYVITAGVQVNGGAGDEVFSGIVAAPDTIHGGDGSDLILNIGTGDRAYGGDGNDTIQIISPNFVHVDGGAGFDTVLLANGTDIDYGAIGVGTFANIERIDLGTGDPGSALTLTASELDAITDGNNVLQITGESNDSLTIMGGTNTHTSQTIDGITYNVFTLGGFTILVEDNTVVVYG